MHNREDVEYKVLLVFPGFGAERDTAEEIVEAALHHLNTEKDEPGMRFAYNVSARLEMVADAEQAYTLLETDDDVATMILHDLPDDEKAALTQACNAKDVPVCHTVETDENAPKKPRPPRGQPRTWKVVFTKGLTKELRAHRIAASTLTAPPEEDEEERMDRVAQLIAVLALGVMEHHWKQNPPRRFPLDPPPESP
jgi:hypothetical protein